MATSTYLARYPPGIYTGKGKPTIPEVLDDFRAYYERNPAWGALHIVLDDVNVADHFVESCIEWAERDGDAEGARLGRILLRMSKTQRRKLPWAVSRAMGAPRYAGPLHLTISVSEVDANGWPQDLGKGQQNLDDGEWYEIHRSKYPLHPYRESEKEDKTS